MPTGRYERRMAKAEVVELLHLGESKVEAITESVGARGVRLITDSDFAPGGVVRLGCTGGTPEFDGASGLLSTSERK